MAATKTATRGIELEPIDRLEEKVKALVALIDRMRTDQTRAAEENDRLAREIEALRARVASGETMTTELSSLKEERDLIRTRVGEMLEQLEALNL
jgi:regulator of replication initiation timing